MSVLNDKTFENMDWLSQAVEPYHCELNDILAKLPDEHIVTYQQAIGLITKGYFTLELSHLVGEMYNTFIEDCSLNWDERAIISDCYKLSTSDSITIDPEVGAIEGEIKLVKIRNLIPDDVVKKLMRSQTYINIRVSDCVREAIMDLGNIFFEDVNDPFYSAKGYKGKLWHIVNSLSESVEKDTFKLRSVVAQRRFTKLVETYLESGNPAALGEIYRVVMMAKSGRVIYEVNAI